MNVRRKVRQREDRLHAALVLATLAMITIASYLGA